jgi:hypothetical protein
MDACYSYGIDALFGQMLEAELFLESRSPCKPDA